MWGIQHFQSYLAGSRFTIYTDHKPFVGLKNIDPGHDPTGRRARWAVQLSTYDFTIAWKPGKFHGNADSVCRIPNETDEKKIQIVWKTRQPLALYMVRILKLMS